MTTFRRILLCGLVLAASLHTVQAQLGFASEPTNIPLQSWSFNNSTTWADDSGDIPISYTNIEFSTLGDGQSLVVQTNVPAWLDYEIYQTNVDWTNLVANGPGSIVFWYGPGWTTTNGGPGDWAELIDVGLWTSNSSVGYFGLAIDPAGSNLWFEAQDGAGSSYHIGTPISWTTNYFHCLAITYSSTNVSIYIDGQIATNDTGGLSVWPGSKAISGGVFLGSDPNGNSLANGLFDLVTTYNYPLDSNDVQTIFSYDYQNNYEIDPVDAEYMDAASLSSFSLSTTTNLAISPPTISSNLASLFVVNSTADILYEVQGCTNLAQGNWFTEDFVLGSELTNWTWADFNFSKKGDLFLRIRNWQDTDGTGIPDWWWLQYFGQATNVSPYADPTGDGWTMLQDFQNGWNPNLFRTPPAPQGLTASYNPTNGTATVSWLPSSGAITNYAVQKYDEVTGQTTDFNYGPSTNSFQDNLSSDSTDLPYSPQLYIDYTLVAQYAAGNSSPSTTSLDVTVPAFNIVSGPGGNLYIVAQNLPNDLEKLVFYRQSDQYLDESGFTIWPYGSGPSYPTDLPDGYFNISSTVITNGIAQIPPAQLYSFGYYDFWVQVVRSNGVASAWDSIRVNTENVFIDARRQIKDNVEAKLCAATEGSPFDINDTWYSSDLVYASFYDQLLNFDPLRPLEDNCVFRDFTYDTSNLCTNNDQGIMGAPNGINYDNLGFLCVTNPIYTVNFASLTTTNTPTAPASLLNFSEATWFFNAQSLVGSNDVNTYGLPYLSEQLVIITNTDHFIFLEEYPGDPGPDQTFVDYLRVENPALQTVGYYFARTGVDPMPEQSTYSPDYIQPPDFASTNTTPLMIAGVGQSMPQIAGYAKLNLQNGYTNIYAYVGQYFDQAYQIDANGNATTNFTGILSPYGNFFATQPGPVALTTMPDIDTGQQGTCIVSCVSMVLDKNHDGIMDMTFSGPDATSQSSPMIAWVNNGHIVPGGLFNPLDHDVEVDGNNLPNYSYGQISCPRDLENFFRLWICGMPVLTNGYQVNLYWANVSSGNPGINLYDSVETNGGTGYLTDTNIAAAQCTAYAHGSSPYSVYFTGPSVAIAEITNGSSFTFPASYFTNSGNQYFLFEGAGIGAGELMLTITDSNSNTVAQTGVWLDLHDTKDLFEQAHTDNVETGPPNTNTSVLVEDQLLPPNPTENQQLVMFVHGLNVPNWEYMDESETMFRRLYWQGFGGRFATFDWPSPIFALIPTGSNDISYFGFNTGEYVSWHSGAALNSYIDSLRRRLPGYSINVAAHSLGNIAANEAIREGAQVDNYALMQAAVSAGAFDGNNTNLIYDYLATTASGSPNANALGGYNNCFTNTARRVNFYNDDDFALYEGVILGVTTHTWEGNQLDYRPDQFTYPTGLFYDYSFDGTNCFFYEYNDAINVENRLITEDFEKKSFVARSRTKAVGAAGLAHDPFALTGGVISTNVSLQNASLGFVGGAAFGNTRPDHSGEFTKTIQNSLPFYFNLLKLGFQIQPALTSP